MIGFFWEGSDSGGKHDRLGLILRLNLQDQRFIRLRAAGDGYLFLEMSSWRSNKRGGSLNPKILAVTSPILVMG